VGKICGIKINSLQANPTQKIVLYYVPLASKSDTPHKPQIAEPKKNKKKSESRFQPIDRRTRAISGGGLNQREPPELPGSPSPRASADTLFSPTSRAPEEQRQSRRRLGLILGGALFYTRVTFETLVVFSFKVP
jgi:hypothetical protein